MKHIKLLFSISLLFYNIDTLMSQSIIDSTKFLFTGDKVNVYSLNKIESSINQYRFIDFTTSDDYTYLKQGDKIYYKKNTDSVLFYDYSLKLNDLFYLKRNNGIDTMRVDSIKMIILDDQKTYKHWYLKSQYQGTPIVWIEGLGEKNYGWIPYDLASFDFRKLKAICKNDDLIFWNSRFNGFEPRIVAPTCNFDSLRKLITVNEIHNKLINVFPNPDNSGYLTINFSDMNESNISFVILDFMGKEIQRIESNEISGDSYKLNVENLAKGVYLLQVITGNRQQSFKFIKG